VWPSGKAFALYLFLLIILIFLIKIKIKLKNYTSRRDAIKFIDVRSCFMKSY